MENTLRTSCYLDQPLTNDPFHGINVRCFTPSEDLASYVKYYWIVQNEDTTKLKRIAKISPSGYPELFFHFGDSVSIDTPEGNLTNDATVALVAGQITKPIYVHLNRHLNCFCVKLQPYTLNFLFDISSAEFTNKAISLNEINPGIQKEIYNELSEAKGDNMKIVIIENYLRKLLGRNDSDFCSVTYAVIDHFRNSNIKIKELEQKLNLCSRTLQRKVREDVGISPKMLYRIIRFNKAYHQIKYFKNVNLQDITFSLGYFDLSHMISEFKEFTGRSPLCYFKKENAFNSLFAGNL